jgi:hypothetical protein
VDTIVLTHIFLRRCTDFFATLLRNVGEGAGTQAPNDDEQAPQETAAQADMRRATEPYWTDAGDMHQSGRPRRWSK